MNKDKLLHLAVYIRKHSKKCGPIPRNGTSDQIIHWIKINHKILIHSDFAGFNQDDYIGDANIETYLRLGLEIPKRQAYLPKSARYVSGDIAKSMIQTVLFAIGVPEWEISEAYNIPMKTMKENVQNHIHHMMHFKLSSNYDFDVLFSNLMDELNSFKKLRRRQSDVYNSKVDEV